MRFVGFTTFSFIILSLVLPSATLRCEERTVVLPNNKTLVLKTLFGNPVHYRNDHLRVTDFRPVFGMLQDWRVGRLCWNLQFIFADRKVNGIMNISSPQYPSLKITFPLWADVPPGYAALGMVIEFFNQRAFPEAWSFLSESGDSWVPFEFNIKMIEPDTSFTFIEWVKVSQNYKDILLAKDNAENNIFNNLPKKSIKLNDGSTISLPFNKNSPFRYADPNFQVENFSPAYDAKARAGDDHWIWVLTGKIRDLGSCRLEIFDPTKNNKLLASLEFKGNGAWNIPFAEKSLTPNFWSWKNQSKDQWVAVKIRFTRLETNVVKEWYEALLIDKNLRRNLAQYH